ncbi:MAG: DNA-3-methyladenine glycosylase [Candidatus Bathyarchaeota archaeon]|nr:DNA-3-methyladenine glycosylase [Candidatus Bathyarchaeota archaeon]
MEPRRPPLGRDFYERDPSQVARGLLGKVIVRRLGPETLSGKIVETEAYYGDGDPASRAYKGRKNYNKPMFGEPGRLFIYMVHTWWLLNIVAHGEGGVGAVLIRGLEPLEGVRVMMRKRGMEAIQNLTNGPGKLGRALAVTNELNGLDITKAGSDLVVTAGEDEVFDTGSSMRIGVARDLPEELRFYIEGNRFVSR